MELVSHDVDAAFLVKGWVSNFEELAREKNVQLSVVAEEPSPARLDVDKFRRIVMNLVSNALKFAPESGWVECRLEAVDARSWRLSVSDDGPGIPAALREAVFERFFQVEDSLTRKHSGTGLGLAIVKEFAELHAGHVEVGESERGGARICFEWPGRLETGVALIAPSQESVLALRDTTESRNTKEDLFSNEASASRNAEPLEHRPRVLVVEDNPEMRRYVVEVLSEQFRVSQAADGAEGYRQALQNVPDVIVSDLMMPSSSGADLLQSVRGNPLLDGVPVIFLTAKADDDLRVQLLRRGAQDYILKPFSDDELLARVSLHAFESRARRILGEALGISEGRVDSLAKDLSEEKKKLEDVSQSLREALAVRDEFISVASHELKTPLSVLKLHNELAKSQLQNYFDNPEMQSWIAHWLKRTDFQLSQITRLVEDMLDTSQIQMGRLRLEPASSDFVQIVRRAVDALTEGLQTAGIRLELQSPDSIPGRWDVSRMEQVAMNLLANAVKYAPASTLRISLEVSGGALKMELTDNGPGIPAEDHERIFERFERASPSSGVSGLGLGLFICRQIVEGHGGRIYASKPESGKGSRFVVELPLNAS